ncbi:Rid family detoxifying hydrolase [Pantoea sp. Aalb]|uniref:Rid family detoxifying hydrolase n=1 Tax=Pantoea sp. Aalb TaxID=2576762 RepID=UPI0013269E99|nr:Rid family detoxifying hydrolase [Pantoea sp. Aalb]MXP67841.1 reactive intermediate/imine deaminase [Pantoea sp. Aalb]
MISVINTTNAPQAIGPYVQGVDLGNIIIISGQIAINPHTGSIPNDISSQTTQSLENIKAIVEATGLKVKNIIKTSIFIIDLNDLSIVNTIYERFFIKNNAIFPARSCVEVSRLPKDVSIEIEAIATRI